MPAITNVYRRGAVYYWRRRLPAGQLPLVKCSTLTCGLSTNDQARARPIGDFVDARFIVLMQSPMRFTITEGELRQLFADTAAEAKAILDRAAIENKFDCDVTIRIGGQETLERVEAAALRLRANHGVTPHGQLDQGSFDPARLRHRP
jgi:hypothetical protein